jgi:hypothetical protein
LVAVTRQVPDVEALRTEPLRRQPEAVPPTIK